MLMNMKTDQSLSLWPGDFLWSCRESNPAQNLADLRKHPIWRRETTRKYVKRSGDTRKVLMASTRSCGGWTRCAAIRVASGFSNELRAGCQVEVGVDVSVVSLLRPRW